MGPLRNRFDFLWKRNIVSDVVQGIIAGGVLAFITFQIFAPEMRKEL
jgi:hypothetical protein